MIVGGYHQAGALLRPALPAGTATSAQEPESAAEQTRQTNPTYFRSISSIGYGSLASAYQSIRAFESAAGVAGGTESAKTGAASPAILSGVGIPAALGAYGETMGLGED